MRHSRLLSFRTVLFLSALVHALPARGQPAQPSTAPANDRAIAMLRDLGPARPDPKRDWLLVVYLDGDNNLDPQGAINLKQMERGLPDSGVDVIVLYDRPLQKEDKDGKLVPTGNHPSVYRVRKDQHPDKLDSEVLKELGAIDMADPNVLAAFIEGSLKAFPARQHALVTWDHGGGWAALTMDENAPGKTDNFDSMDMPRLRAGLVAGMKAAGLKKWDIIAFDMCLMAQLEVAAEVHDLADVMIASEAEEPGKGIPYTRVLEILGKGTLGRRRIATDIVAEFDKFHKADGERSTTLSALDLSAFDEVNDKLNALADKLVPAMPKGWSALTKSYFYAEQYAGSRDDFRKGTHALQSVDLMDAVKKCRAAMPDFPAEAEYKDLVQSMDRLVIASANSERRRMSNGVAVYAPVIKDAWNPEYEKLNFAKVSHWPKLVQSVYPEQAKNDHPPKFGKIELVDADNKPAAALRPLSGFGLSIEVEGKNMVWVRHMPGVRDAALGGVRVLGVDYIVDANFLQKLMKGADKFAQDVDLIMPQLADGANKLRQPQYGLVFLLSNGEKTVQAMFDNSDLKDPLSLTIPVRIEHPSLGKKPVNALLHGDGISLGVTSTTLVQEQPDGRTVYQQIDPPADAKITPLFYLYKDDGSQERCAKDSLAWKKGLSFTMDLLPPGDYEEILVAETMTCASTTARCRYKAVADERLTKAKDSWQAFKPEMMVGTWDWALPTDPPKSVDTSMTVKSTRDPLVYDVTLDSPGDEGKRKVTSGTLILELHDQPFYRLILDPETKGPPGVMLGTRWWAPEAGKGRVLTRSLGLDLNIVWIKKEELAHQGPAQPAAAVPDPSPNLTLLPEAAKAGPPAWAHPGTRLTYSSAASTIASAGKQIVLDDKGNWVTKDTGQRWKDQDAPMASGAGYSVFQIGYIDRDVVQLNCALYGLDPNDRTVQVAGGSGMVTNAGCASDLWVNPDVLKDVKETPKGDVRITRVPYTVNNKKYNAIRFETLTGNGCSAYVYDLETGLRIFYGSSSQSGGCTQLATGSLVEIKDVDVPWKAAAVPAWVGKFNELTYQGTKSTIVAGAGQLDQPMTIVTTPKARRDGWLRTSSTFTIQTFQGMPPDVSQSEGASGPAAGGQWIGPDAIPKLKVRQVIDQNDFTKTVTSVTDVNPRSVTISEVGQHHRIDSTYDAATGMLVAVKTTIQVGIGQTTCKAQLVGQK